MKETLKNFVKTYLAAQKYVFTFFAVLLAVLYWCISPHTFSSAITSLIIAITGGTIGHAIWKLRLVLKIIKKVFGH